MALISASEKDSALYRSLTLPDLPEFKVHLFEQVASTNTIAWDLLRQEEPAGTVVIALAQTAGRGQWGHQWQSSVGGLYLSLGIRPNLPVEQAGQLTLSSAWGVAMALRGWGIPVQIKWFNDLVIGDRVINDRGMHDRNSIRKLGGILAETRIAQGRIQQAVIGVGMNWQNSVPEVGISLQTVLATQSSFRPTPSIDSLEILAAIVLQGLRLGYTYWQRVDSFVCAAAYEELLVNLGQTIAFQGKRGVISGITPTGQLRIRVEGAIDAEVCLPPGAVSLGYGETEGK
ncbi:biotin--[acetyl-CoA-carboxylase] ligase [filamentous cyanobacterium CCP1]|nr:biotin--[acetyl-CoA-carboxylase] ligase [filamentous cyanobacterium CCP2]PSB65846.1 biotin--[acetyl-CoA-carboxylase] ligase [filamentous cyanobacterium CCP1]